ncbi:uncharacterized protein LOC117265692 [Epinephelus lanceolatus]
MRTRYLQRREREIERERDNEGEGKTDRQTASAYFRRISSSDVFCALGANVSSSPFCASAAAECYRIQTRGGNGFSETSSSCHGEKNELHHMIDDVRRRLKDIHRSVCRADDVLQQETLHVSA